MNEDSSEELTQREKRLDEAVLHYIGAMDRGDSFDRDAFLKRYADVAGGLEEFLNAEQALGVLRCSTSAEHHRAKEQQRATGLRPGTRLGDYEILEEIARGGMAIVYRARQLSLERVVALKVFQRSLQDDSEESRFKREAEAAAALEHPSIVPVYDIGSSGQFLFIALKLINGGNLADRAAEFNGRVVAVATLVESIARAVHFAHERGVLHRDLKPANVLVDENHQPHLTDFGLAKRLDIDPGLTSTGAIVGTPKYMAPEQVGGTTDEVTTSVDVYGLGGILYELVTGAPPFTGSTPLEVIQKLVAEEPTPPSRLFKRLPNDLEIICMKCLEKDRHQRYGSALELAEDLSRFVRGEPILARPSSTVSRCVKWARRHPTLAVLSVVGCIGLVAVLWMGEKERRRTAELRHFQYADRLTHAAKLYAIRDLTTARATLKAQESGASEEDLRDFEWGHVSLLVSGQQHQLDVGPVEDWRARRVAVGLNFFAATDLSSAVVVRDTRDLSVVARVTANEPVSHLSFGETDSLLFIVDQDGSRFIELGSGATNWIRAPTAGPVALSPDGRRLAESDNNKGGTTIRIVDPRTDEILRYVDPGDCLPRTLSFSSDGSKLFAMLDGCERDVLAWDAVTWSRTAAFEYEGVPLRISSDHDGRLFAIGGRAASSEGDDRLILTLHDANDGRLLHRLLEPDKVNSYGFAATPVDVSPSGRTVVGTDGLGDLVYWDATTGLANRRIHAHESEVAEIHWLRNGRMLLSVAIDGELKIWDTWARAAAVHSAHEDIVWDLAIGDGDEFALTGSDYSYTAWRLNRYTQGAALEPVGTFTLPLKGPVEYGLLSPSGKRLALGERMGRIHVYRLHPKTTVEGNATSSAVYPRLAATLESTVECAPESELFALAFSPDEAYLLSSHLTSPLRVLERLETPTGSTWSVCQSLQGPGGVRSLVFSPNGALIAFAQKQMPTLQVLSFPEGKARWTGRVRGNIRHVAFSPDSARLTTSTDNGMVEVWRVRDGLRLQSFQAHEGQVDAVVFSPNGRRLATGGIDSSIRLWDLTVINGEPLALEVLRLHGHKGRVTILDFASDGLTLLSAGGRIGNFGEIGVWSAARQH